jgi:hypothetical protein
VKWKTKRIFGFYEHELYYEYKTKKLWYKFKDVLILSYNSTTKSINFIMNEKMIDEHLDTKVEIVDSLDHLEYMYVLK